MLDNSRYTYIDDKLVNERGESVMMGWEKPIMEKVANIISHNNGDILNIGFGMGIVDTYIQEHNPNSHTIIESHPDVIDYIKTNHWLDKDIKFIFNKWQNVIGDLGTFDGIYLDTWYDVRAPYVKSLIDKCLKIGGVFSIWHNEDEFNKILLSLDDKYVVLYEYIKNDKLIVSEKEQFKNGGFYIDPKLENVVLPIIKRIK